MASNVRFPERGKNGRVGAPFKNILKFYSESEEHPLFTVNRSFHFKPLARFCPSMQGRLPVTPAAWYKWLTYEKVSSDRPHQHDLVLVPDPAADLSSNSDKENQQPPAKSNTIHLLCLDCHGRFIISAHPKEGSDSRSCTKAGYMTHHFHLIGDNTEKCCGCKLQLTLDFVPPVVPLSIIEEMSDTRKVNITYAAYTQQKQTGAAPTVSSALATMLIYIRDMLTGVRRNISVEKQSFKDRIGADNAR